MPVSLYCLPQEARDSAEGVPDDEWSDNETNDKIRAAGVMINRLTGIPKGQNWDTNDEDFPLIKAVCIMLAASLIMQDYENLKAAAFSKRDAALKLLDPLIESGVDDTVQENLTNVVVSDYESYNLGQQEHPTTPPDLPRSTDVFLSMVSLNPDDNREFYFGEDFQILINDLMVKGGQ